MSGTDMHYVYVLTSSISDLYYEQFYLSSSSLRLFNPDADIILLVDRKTKNTLLEKRSGYEKIVSDIKVVDCPNELTQKEISRWLKTSIPNYVSGDFLFIDCDTIITEKIDCSVFNNIKIGAVLDTHVPLSRHHLRNTFLEDGKRLGFLSAFGFDSYFNGGLIVYKESQESHRFFERWHTLWLKSREMGNSQDMPSLNQANCDCDNIITELDGSWNCQISHNGLPYLNNAKIIHYYATSLLSFTPPFIPASDEVLQSIKENGTISADVMKLLNNPRAAFFESTRVISDKNTLDILDSNFFSKLLWLK
jgi:lipopolysaccharide biosynthesis glycosyltransferase